MSLRAVPRLAGRSLRDANGTHQCDCFRCCNRPANLTPNFFGSYRDFAHPACAATRTEGLPRVRTSWSRRSSRSWLRFANACQNIGESDLSTSCIPISFLCRMLPTIPLYGPKVGLLWTFLPDFSRFFRTSKQETPQVLWTQGFANLGSHTNPPFPCIVKRLEESPFSGHFVGWTRC